MKPKNNATNAIISPDEEMLAATLNYRNEYSFAEKSAFTALVTSNPFTAYNAILGHGVKAFHHVRNMILPEETEVPRIRDLMRSQVQLWQDVSPKLYKAYSTQMIKTALTRVAFNKLPSMVKPSAHGMLQGQLTKLFVYKQEIAHQRCKKMGGSPYETLIREHNPEYSQERLDGDLSVMNETVARIRGQHKEAAVKLMPNFNLDVPRKKKKEFFQDIAQSMGLPMDRVKIYHSASPAALGSPRFAQIANNFNCKNFMVFMEDGVHEKGHALHKLNLPADEKEQAFAVPLSTGHDEALAYFWENKIFETASYTQFITEKIRHDLNGDPAVWTSENVDTYHKALRFDTNRIMCCDVGNWIHLNNLIGIEQAIINGDQRPEDYYALWREATETSFGTTLAENNFDYTKNFQPFAGLIGNFPGYIEGSFLSPQLFEAAQQQIPDLDGALRQGNLRPVSEWLNVNIHSKGSHLPIDTLYGNVTGQPRQRDSFKRVISAKYGLDT